MPKTNLLGVLLTLTLALVALWTAWLFFTYVKSAKKLQPLQTEVVIINRNQTAIQGLLTEALEYSKRDPTIEPLLQSMGIRIRTNSPQSSPKAAAAAK